MNSNLFFSNFTKFQISRLFFLFVIFLSTINAAETSTIITNTNPTTITSSLLQTPFKKKHNKIAQILLIVGIIILVICLLVIYCCLKNVNRKKKKFISITPQPRSMSSFEAVKKLEQKSSETAQR